MVLGGMILDFRSRANCELSGFLFLILLLIGWVKVQDGLIDAAKPA